MLTQITTLLGFTKAEQAGPRTVDHAANGDFGDVFAALADSEDAGLSERSQGDSPAIELTTKLNSVSEEGDPDLTIAQDGKELGSVSIAHLDDMEAQIENKPDVRSFSENWLHGEVSRPAQPGVTTSTFRKTEYPDGDLPMDSSDLTNEPSFTVTEKTTKVLPVSAILPEQKNVHAISDMGKNQRTDLGSVPNESKGPALSTTGLTRASFRTRDAALPSLPDPAKPDVIAPKDAKFKSTADLPVRAPLTRSKISDSEISGRGVQVNDTEVVRSSLGRRGEQTDVAGKAASRPAAVLQPEISTSILSKEPGKQVESGASLPFPNRDAVSSASAVSPSINDAREPKQHLAEQTQPKRVPDQVRPGQPTATLATPIPEPVAKARTDQHRVDVSVPTGTKRDSILEGKAATQVGFERREGLGSARDGSRRGNPANPIAGPLQPRNTSSVTRASGTSVEDNPTTVKRLEPQNLQPHALEHVLKTGPVTQGSETRTEHKIDVGQANETSKTRIEVGVNTLQPNKKPSIRHLPIHQEKNVDVADQKVGAESALTAAGGDLRSRRVEPLTNLVSARGAAYPEEQPQDSWPRAERSMPASGILARPAPNVPQYTSQTVLPLSPQVGSKKLEASPVEGADPKGDAHPIRYEVKSSVSLPPESVSTTPAKPRLPASASSEPKADLPNVSKETELSGPMHSGQAKDVDVVKTEGRHTTTTATFALQNPAQSVRLPKPDAGKGRTDTAIRGDVSEKIGKQSRVHGGTTDVVEGFDLNYVSQGSQKPPSNGRTASNGAPGTVQQVAHSRVTFPSIQDADEPRFVEEAPLGGTEIRATSSFATGVASAGAPAARPDTAAILRQVAEMLPRLGENATEIKLSPEELGRVRLQLVSGEAGMLVHVQAERPETLDLLRRNIDQLAKSLADAGQDASAFTFSDDRGRAQFGSGKSAAPNNESMTEEPSNESSLSSGHQDGVDILV